MRCGKSKLTCPGYTKSIVFQLNSNSQASDGISKKRTGFRRTVLSEAARQAMSRYLVTSLPGTITDCLNEIDEANFQVGESRQPLAIRRGPFNVFTLARECTTHLEASDQSQFLIDDEDSLLLNWNDVSQLGLWDTGLDLDFASILNSPQVHRGHEAPTASSHATVSLPGSHSLAYHLVDQPPASQGLGAIDVEHIQEPPGAEKAFSPPQELLLTPESLQIPPSLDTTNREMQDILLLINHFTTTVVSYLTPWRHEKTPWHIFFVPHMRQCATLHMLNTPISHADEAIFNGFSAITALSIGGSCGSQEWVDKGENYRRKSYEACQIMLQGAYDTPKRYKYKRILMALQVAVLMSTLAGDPITEEYYFLETEKLIKLKGLGRKNSRKVRMLHRFYAYERLLYESTCMRGIDFNHRLRVTNDVNSVSIIPYSGDNMAFRAPDWGSLDELNVDSDPNVEGSAENEVLGLWPDALCAKVAGIPERWITILLHIVLLGKHKDAVEQAGRSDTDHLQEFHNRARTLETCIQKQVLQVDLVSIPDSLITGRKPCGDSWLNVLDCFRHALHIYFYRRIYDVSSLWLQDKVEKVRHCLARIAEGNPQSGDPPHSGSIGVLWASFVASCEAEGKDLQAFFADWYQQAAIKTGISTWLNSLSLSQQIWETKMTAGGERFTWIDLLRKQQRDKA
ncbi:hypothetical protein Neosp_011985 [[Neocosmospora] mangrovei]